jgi:hypothetical protein
MPAPTPHRNSGKCVSRTNRGSPHYWLDWFHWLGKDLTFLPVIPLGRPKIGPSLGDSRGKLPCQPCRGPPSFQPLFSRDQRFQRAF